jgi:hypothetical protein
MEGRGAVLMLTPEELVGASLPVGIHHEKAVDVLDCQR